MDVQIYPESDTMLVSIGHLPAAVQVQALMDIAYARFKINSEGEQADYYPALARVQGDLLGICIAGIDGTLYSAGDALYPFTIMSVSKPFLFALVCQELGPEQSHQKLGMNSTGLPFNSILAIEQSSSRLTNPMVNPGAITATSLGLNIFASLPYGENLQHRGINLDKQLKTEAGG